MTPLASLVAHARSVRAGERAATSARLRAFVGTRDAPGAILLETCHRVELVGPASVVGPAAARLARGGSGADGVARLGHEATVEHVVRLALGLDSAVVGEDQVLHQLRVAIRDARQHAPLDPALDRLLDASLRAGRRARTWLPARRPTLADTALDRAGLESPGRVLVVGAGSMGRLVAASARSRGHALLVGSRTAARAAAVAASAGGRAVPLDPGSQLASQVDAVVVALSGGWPISNPTSDALVAGSARVVDLSSPSAVPPDLAAALGPRLVTIDDLATAPSLDERLRARLETLVAETVDAFAAWSAREDDRMLARALVDRADDVRTSELAALWRRMPDLDPAIRSEVERMASDLTGRLLRDPLERLGEDVDGGRARAARELFRL